MDARPRHAGAVGVIGSSFPAVIDALVAALQARAGLADVTVSSAPMGGGTPRRAIVFMRATGDSEWAALGAGSREERYAVEGLIQSSDPRQEEAGAKATRDDAKALLDEIQAEVGRNKPDVDEVRTSELVVLSWEQGLNPSGRFSQVAFEIRVTARLS